MLVEPKNKTFLEFVHTSTKEDLIWMQGYLSGLLSLGSEDEKQTLQGKLTLLYGTETGNSKKIAGMMAKKAREKGLLVKLSGMDQYRLGDLEKEDHFFIIISTHGEGEPPDSAKPFFDYIHKNTLQLHHLRYGVLALGDSVYPLFCKAGKDLDARLETLGARRVVPLKKCDTDFEIDAERWFKKVLSSFDSDSGNRRVILNKGGTETRKPVGKKNFRATVLSNIPLNDKGSEKETYHIELSAADVAYQPGDALGIFPENPAAVVEEALRVLGVKSDDTVPYFQEPVKLSDLLQKKLNIFHLPERLVKKYAELVQQSIPPVRVDLLDLLKTYPIKGADLLEDLVKILEPITPRLYSISSSPEAHGGELHLTVARDRFSVDGQIHYGRCSDQISQFKEGDEICFYVKSNRIFKLPASDKDIIMIGPGTGIAPFRSFLAEREAVGATGKNWLLFGAQHFQTDFLYQIEIQAWAESGLLNRVDVAFSRDQPEKIYVQHKIWEKKEAFFRWLEAGAYLYVCGAKDPMSINVEKIILQLIEQVGKTDPEAYLEHLKEESRYLKDVY
ncbi:MAG: sulfite reductase flavoprotein subunit alpha [Flavobacteriales bacterium Tduv]